MMLILKCLYIVLSAAILLFGQRNNIHATLFSISSFLFAQMKKKTYLLIAHKCIVNKELPCGFLLLLFAKWFIYAYRKQIIEWALTTDKHQFNWINQTKKNASNNNVCVWIFLMLNHHRAIAAHILYKLNHNQKYEKFNCFLKTKLR